MGPAAPSRDPNDQNCCVVCGLTVAFIVGSIFLLAGIIALSLGAVDKANLSALTPEADFSMLAEKCTIADYDVKLRTLAYL
eukprot:scaffold151339_cov39-Prasinocladus_malaysianus.AAC.1